jgi:transcription termination factor Rho
VTAEALDQSVLESKDKEQLTAIAQALGIKTTARLKKADIIHKILESTGALHAPGNGHAAEPVAQTLDLEAPAERGAPDADPPAEAPRTDTAPAAATVTEPAAPAAAAVPEVVLGPDGEPLAEWEVELLRQGVDTTVTEAAPAAPPVRSAAPSTDADADADADGAEHPDGEGESRSSRRRRRRRGKNREDGAAVEGGGQAQPAPSQGGGQPQGGGQQEPPPQSAQVNEPVQVSGYLDLRDEGYGFLRVNGYLASRDDVYISVKQSRQYGLRKGDFVTGLSRVAGRNEKNPALLEVHSINGQDPEKARSRPKFEDLTALFPDEKLRLEHDRLDMTTRIIDLVSPIGKGQRGLIVSPPKAGKTTILKTIAMAIERNNPEVKLIYLLIDERPEEVTDIRRSVRGEVISSTFDRPSDEHTHVAELALEKAKRMVEMGDDVVIILDGITRLSRAYNLAAPASGRILSGGIDAGALYPPKRFFGAARNVEEGGSLTILATALVETNSRMDEAIFEEFKGTGNMELRLDRRLSERRVYPAIDVDASSTRHEELLFDRRQLQQVWKLRRVLSGLAAEGSAGPALELLTDRLKTFSSNDEFLNEIAKQGSM